MKCTKGDKIKVSICYLSIGDLHFLWTNMSDWTGDQYRCGVWHEQRKTLVVGSQTSLRIDSE